MQLSLRGMINKEKKKKMQEHPNSILQGTQGPLQGFSKSSDPLCRYFTNGACSDAPPPYRDPQVSQRAAGHSNIKENHKKRLEWSVIITKTEVVNPNEHFQQSQFFSWILFKSLERGTWRYFAPFRGEMYHECLDTCYKVAYKSTHGRKARAWGIHWL